MKKVFLTIFIFLITMIMCASYVKINGQDFNNIDEQLFVEEISEKMIRFHVLANSNTVEDQELKVEVKNRVIEYITPKFQGISSIDEARVVLMNNNDDIIKIAEEYIKEKGYTYKVKTTLGRENFPVKVYGNITLPQGEYEAYRILIGDAEGENWWCVMFPPLCFVDVTKGEVSYDETEEKMKDVLTDDEFKAVDNTEKKESKKKKENVEDKIELKEKDNDDKSKVKVKFKIFDLFENKN